MVRRILPLLTLAVVLTGLRPGEARGATGTLLRNDTGLYPRAVQLQHSGAANGRILASVVTFGPQGGVGAIYESTNNGQSFTQIASISDTVAAKGLCCSTLYELPQQVGALPAGTLLWAASMGQDAGSTRRMSLRVWKSTDAGRTWSYLSTVRTAPNTGGLWEPEFSVDASGRLVCHFADETDSRYSQRLARSVSTDGLTWGAPINTVASATFGHRPGMPTVRRLPTGPYVMTYEVCGVPGQYDCAARIRWSTDGSNWGTATDLGPIFRTLDGKYFAHTPVLAWRNNGTERGQLLVTGQQMLEANGAQSGDSGGMVFVNTEGGYGAWYLVQAPVRVHQPANNFCPNYSPALLPLADGNTLLEISTDYDGSVCKPYFGSGPAAGTRDGTGFMSGGRYRLLNVQNGLCLDVSADSRVPGGNIQQWTCNNLGPQNFIFTSVGNNLWTVKGQNSGLCVDVAGGSTAGGANVQQEYCVGTSSQRWRIVNVGWGYYSLVNENSGQCMDDAGGATQPGANVAQWYCNQLAPQIWKVEPR
ncbi:RICIN domain-containing protein [Archangium sp.]|uniref:RICIN domain-containing protein n=1 Tax=Archangium sp. TaxID=1872627 RepID=UPI002D63FE66|nr:RICIN domain-containing protein [Archangium sp.]HYO58750.1 RICIN domain-containing protein [Archangium sp.]